MPKLVRGPDGTIHQFPDEATDAQISSALGAIPLSNAKEAPQAKTWVPADSDALILAGGAKAIPAAATIATEVATNPVVKQAGSLLGRTVGFLAPIASNPLNPVNYIAAPSMSWNAGRGGYRLADLMQKAAAPVANALESAKPFAQTASTLSGAQGVLDLAQMADKKRTDIGFLGVGTRNSAIEALQAKGLSKEQAENVFDHSEPLVNAIFRTVMSAFGGKNK